MCRIVCHCDSKKQFKTFIKLNEKVIYFLYGNDVAKKLASNFSLCTFFPKRQQQLIKSISIPRRSQSTASQHHFVITITPQTKFSIFLLHQKNKTLANNDDNKIIKKKWLKRTWNENTKRRKEIKSEEAPYSLNGQNPKKKSRKRNKKWNKRYRVKKLLLRKFLAFRHRQDHFIDLKIEMTLIFFFWPSFHKCSIVFQTQAKNVLPPITLRFMTIEFFFDRSRDFKNVSTFL